MAQSGAQTSGSANTGASASAGQSNAQVQGNANASASGTADLAAGNTINAVLSKPVDAKKNKEGDPVIAKTTQNVKSAGEVIIPQGSRLLGHITEVRPRAKGVSDSTLGIVFDQAVLENGQQIPLHTVIQAIGSSQTAASSNGKDTMGDLGGAAQVSRPTPGNNNTFGGELGPVGYTGGAATDTCWPHCPSGPPAHRPARLQAPQPAA